MFYVVFQSDDVAVLQNPGSNLQQLQFSVIDSSFFNHMQRIIHGLRTSLCLQVKPQHIAAGAIFIAANFLQIDLPLDEEAWWQEFEIRSWQLEEVCYQILEVYEEVQIPSPSEEEGIEASGAANQMPAQATASIEEHATSTETKDAPEQTVQVEFKENLPPESLLPEKMEEAQSVAKLGLEGCGEEGQEDDGNVDASDSQR